MKTAETAARRGHQVVLLERRGELGGQLRLAAAVKGREDVSEVIRYLEVQLTKLDVDVRRSVSASADQVLSLDPGHVVVATGSEPTRTIIGNLSHGIKSVPGLDGDQVLTSWDVIEQRAEVGQRVLLVDDGEGGWKGISLALELAEDGHEVHMSTPLGYVGAAIGPFSQNKLIPRIFEAGIVTHPFSLLTEVRADTAMLRKQGKPFELSGLDTVVLAGWHTPSAGLYFELKGRGPAVARVGDAVAPRSMQEAIHSAERVARLV